MNHLGHISIQGNKVIFVYHELEKPNLADYSAYGIMRNLKWAKCMKKYKASKREVDVNNVFKEKVSRKWRFEIKDSEPFYEKIYAEHNQPCEAEVNGKAIITKIL